MGVADGLAAVGGLAAVEDWHLQRAALTALLLCLSVLGREGRVGLAAGNVQRSNETVDQRELLDVTVDGQTRLAVGLFHEFTSCGIRFRAPDPCTALF